MILYIFFEFGFGRLIGDQVYFFCPNQEKNKNQRMRPLACVKLSNLKKSQGAQKWIFFAETWNVGSFYVLECKYQKIVKSFFFFAQKWYNARAHFDCFKNNFLEVCILWGKRKLLKNFQTKILIFKVSAIFWSRKVRRAQKLANAPISIFSFDLRA